MQVLVPTLARTPVFTSFRCLPDLPPLASPVVSNPCHLCLHPSRHQAHLTCLMLPALGLGAVLPSRSLSWFPKSGLHCFHVPRIPLYFFYFKSLVYLCPSLSEKLHGGRKHVLVVHSRGGNSISVCWMNEQMTFFSSKEQTQPEPFGKHQQVASQDPEEKTTDFCVIAVTCRLLPDFCVIAVTCRLLPDFCVITVTCRLLPMKVPSHLWLISPKRSLLFS